MTEVIEYEAKQYEVLYVSKPPGEGLAFHTRLVPELPPEPMDGRALADDDDQIWVRGPFYWTEGVTGDEKSWAELVTSSDLRQVVIVPKGKSVAVLDTEGLHYNPAPPDGYHVIGWSENPAPFHGHYERQAL